jgi:hypothetical protein
MPYTLTPIPIADAVAKLNAKAPVTSVLRTAGWAGVPQALRDRAFFSAGVDWADFLDRAKAGTLAALEQRKERVRNGDAFVSRSSFIGDLRQQVLAAGRGQGTDPHDVTDLASRARLGLIFDVQTQSAMGHARWTFEQRPAVLNAFPAQELLRTTARLPRTDWEQRWTELGGRLFDRRMVALKTDPIWARLSRFGTPWPPFDFGSKRELRDVDRAEAEALGLLEPEVELQPIEQQFNDGLEASARNIDPATRERLQAIFGNQVEFEGDRVRWRGQPA